MYTKDIASSLLLLGDPWLLAYTLGLYIGCSNNNNLC